MDSRQIVVFSLANETYGLNIHKVYEIIMVPRITRIPRTPYFIEGVINLRGNIIPIFDLRTRLGLPRREVDDQMRVIIVEISENVAGMIVDGVSEVMSVPEEKLEPPSPLVVNSVEGEYLEGVINLEEQLIIMLSLENVFTGKERESLAGMSFDKRETATVPIHDPSVLPDEAGGSFESSQ